MVEKRNRGRERRGERNKVVETEVEMGNGELGRIVTQLLRKEGPWRETRVMRSPKKTYKC